MRYRITIIVGAALGLAAPGLAQTVVAPEKVKPEDVVTSPLDDMNIKKRDVPPALVTAMEKPYDLTGFKTCAGFRTAIADLDAVLGDDIDVAQDLSDDDKRGNTAGAVAKSLIGSVIPFRGVIREISGANARERAWERALYAGSVRRAFLKGVGQQRGCAYPARSATPQVLASLASQREAARLAREKQPEEKTAGTPTAPQSEAVPVVQSAPVVQAVPSSGR